MATLDGAGSGGTELDGAELAGVADELERRARRVAEIGECLAAEASLAIWTSVAADAFRGVVERRRAWCLGVSHRLRECAVEARRVGDAAAFERARLRRLAELPERAAQSLGHLVGLP